MKYVLPIALAILLTVFLAPVILLGFLWGFVRDYFLCGQRGYASFKKQFDIWMS